MTALTVSPPAGSQSKPFWLIVALTYIFPVLLFALLVFLIPDASFLTRYLLTVGTSSLWFLMGWWGMRQTGISFAEIGLTLRSGLIGLALVLVGWAIYAVVVVPLTLSSGGSVSSLFNSTFPIIFQQWLFVGISEEVLFRGFYLNYLARQFTAPRFTGWRGMAAALVVTNLVFSTMHIPQRLYQVWLGQMSVGTLLFSLLMVFILGMYFAYLYLRTKNILFAGLAHGSCNAALLGASGDLAPILIFILVAEGYVFWKRRQSQK